MHARDLRQPGVALEHLLLVQVWPEAGSLFDEREQAALAWAETVTRVAEIGVPDSTYKAAAALFSEKELVDLMNAYNRIATSFRATPAAARG
jgi:alkylhydroperoxidase family enzyme